MDKLQHARFKTVKYKIQSSYAEVKRFSLQNLVAKSVVIPGYSLSQPWVFGWPSLPTMHLGPIAVNCYLGNLGKIIIVAK